MIPNIKPELQELIQNISTRNMYRGNKIPDSIMRMFTIVETDFNCGIEVPYWLGVLERGRGPRLKTTDHKLYLKIKKWMTKKNMFKTRTEEGHINEAKRLTWYINHYGNEQFNRGNPIYVDVYNTERKKTIEKINEKFSFAINKITMDIL